MINGELCDICPRHCLASRKNGKNGYCSVPNEMLIPMVSLHKWEEPCISGQSGSGTIFFSGCNLRCVFCQNQKISQIATGKNITIEELAKTMLELEEAGANNINLVTPTHYALQIKESLIIAKNKLKIPVIYNSGGYDSVDTLKSLEGLIDIYMPDFKYFSSELSQKYSKASDYFEVASEAIKEMYRQVGSCVFYEKNGQKLLKKGLLIRHLVLPNCRKDSIIVLNKLVKILPKKDFLISVMRQYTPDFVDKEKYPELSRRVTTFEYNSVLEVAEKLGLDGFSQLKESAFSKYTPNFNC